MRDVYQSKHAQTVITGFFKLLIPLALATIVFTANPAQALTFTGSAPGNNPGQTNSASVTFSLFVSGSTTDLFITLENTAGYKPNDPADILTALFFSIPGDPSLTRGSAVLSSGSTVVDIGSNPQPIGGVVGGEWAYASGLNHAPGGANQGISASGLNFFGPHDLFPGPRLPDDQNGNPPAGVAYGLTTATDDGSQYNGGLRNRGFIQTGVDFVMLDVPGNFQLSEISNVSVQYGTSLGEPNIELMAQVPEPSTIALAAAAIGLLGLVHRGKRR